jgi:hypothetical protein
MYLGASCALDGNAEFPFGYMGSKYAVGGRCTQNNPTSFLSVSQRQIEQSRCVHARACAEGPRLISPSWADQLTFAAEAEADVMHFGRATQ